MEHEKKKIKEKSKAASENKQGAIYETCAAKTEEGRHSAGLRTRRCAAPAGPRTPREAGRAQPSPMTHALNQRSRSAGPVLSPQPTISSGLQLSWAVRVGKQSV